MMFTIRELIDLAIMTVAIGYIFSGFIKRQPQEGYDPIKFYQKTPIIEDLKYGIIVAAPAVVLHELAHKFTAMAFGASAILHAPYEMYALAIILKLLNFPLFFFVGGYVSYPDSLLPWQSAIVSAAGPFLNLILYLGCLALVNFKLVKRKHYPTIGIISKLNLLLFGFNLIPLPGFDGFHLFSSLLRFLFGR